MAPSLQLHDVLTPVVDARISSDGDDLLIVRRNEAFEVNALGSRIWELMMDDQTIASIANTLETEYEVEREVVLGDVLEFATRLYDLGLVVKSS